MTLIEILVVLGVITALVGIVVPKIGVKQNPARALFREFTAITHQLHSEARLKNKYYRLVLHLDPDVKKPSTYWIESGGSNARIISKKEQDAIEQSRKENKDNKDAPVITDGFAFDPGIISKKRPLPDHFRFPTVLQQGVKTPATEGDVYVHFLPEGFVQDTLIQLSDGKNTWTMHIAPLTGTLDVIDGAKTFEDFKR